MARYRYEGEHPETPPGVVVIPLTRGYVAWIDESDLSVVSEFKWYAHVPAPNVAYACSATGHKESGRKTRIVRMHVLICGQERQVDHVSHEMFLIGVVDNRRANLRSSDQAENMRNQRKCQTSKTSIFKGVGLEQFSGRWKACINQSGRSATIGRFDVEAHAAYAYDIEAVKRFGQFALTNFQVPGSTNYLFG